MLEESFKTESQVKSNTLPHYPCNLELKSDHSDADEFLQILFCFVILKKSKLKSSAVSAVMSTEYRLQNNPSCE